MPKGVGGDPFRESSPAHSLVKRTLHMRFVQMISPQFLCRRNLRERLLWKEPLPDKLLGCRGIFLFKPVVEKDSRISRHKVFVMDLLYYLKLGIQLQHNRLRQGKRAVLLPFSMDREYSGLEVEILHPQL